MSNSLVVANIEVQVQDALQSNIPAIVFRTVPPISYPSSAYCNYSGFTQLNYGQTQQITNNLNWSFLYVRNAGARGTIVCTVSTIQSPSQASIFYLTPGGVLLYGNNSSNILPSTTISAVVLAPVDENPIIAEWLLGQ
jgi:hypothetical protein